MDIAKPVLSRVIAAFLTAALCAGSIPLPLYAEDTSTTTDRSSLEERLEDRGADTSAPSISPHGDENAQAESEAGAVVLYTSPSTLDDVDGVGTATCTLASGSTFAIGTTTVTCSATDAAGNSATPVLFSVVVAAMPVLEATSTATTTPDMSGTASTTPVDDSVGTTTATSTPPVDTGTATTTDTGGGGGGGAAVEAGAGGTADDTASSTSSTSSGEVAPEESGADNTDFEDIVNGPPPPGEDDPRPVVDASATSTEALAVDPQFVIASSTDGTGNKIGGTIFTGNAVASTTVKNILNITSSNIDGPGTSNSTIFTADTGNDAELTTENNTHAATGENRALGGEGLATVRTGRATATAEAINVVNTNLFNSEGLVLFLNPFRGDGLDLRDQNLSYFFNEGAGASPTQFGCTILTCLNSSALSVLNKNTATVHNDILVRAATGGNTASSTDAGGVDITTGNAYAAANVLNMVNTNFINSSYFMVSFNNFGDLNDDVVLPSSDFFDRLLAQGNSLPELNSSSYIVNNDNDEHFFGTTTANAVTGGNVATTTGLGHGDISTGNAYTSSHSYTAANQTRVGGSSVLFTFRVWGNWSGSVKGLPAGLAWRQTEYGIEIYSTGGQHATTTGEYNSSAFLASSTNTATLDTNVEVWAETGGNISQTEHATGTIMTGDAYAAANVVNLVNTNIVNRNWMFGMFNIFGDWSGDISFGGHSPDLKVQTVVEAPSPILPDSEVTYRFTVSNNGVADATGVVLNAEYDDNLLLLTRANVSGASTPTGTSWNLGSIAAGASREVVVTGRLRVRDLPAGIFLSVPLVARVEGVEHDQSDGNNVLQTTITVSAPGSGGSSTPPPSGGGGNSTPPPSGGGGGTPPPSGGGGGPLPSSGGGTPVPPSGSGTSAPGGAGGGSAAAGAGGGSGLAASTIPSTPSPKLTLKKSANISTTTLPALVDYQVTVNNDFNWGALFSGKLTDTLYGPDGTVVNARSWDLETVAPADLIKLTYSVEFGTSTKPGIYKNVARVTGIQNHPTHGNQIKPIEATHTISFSGGGLVLGTSTVGTSSCEPVVTVSLRPGSSNRGEVSNLQTFLAGQPGIYPQGLVTGVFGPLTTAAVRAFQLKYASEILAPLGLSGPTGLVYASTIRKINELGCGGMAPLPQEGAGSASTGSGAAAPAKPKAPAPKAAATEPPAPPVLDLAKTIKSLFKFW